MKIFTKIILTFYTAAFLISCGEDRSYQYLELTEECQWIYSQMKEHYLWSDSIKKPALNKFFSKSETFYKELLLKGDVTSCFGDSVWDTSYGISYVVLRDPLNIQPSKNYALVAYVEPNSPAHRSGISRGMWITGVGNKSLTTSNHTMLIKGEATTLSTSKIVTNEEQKPVWSTGDTIHIEAAEPCAGTAIPLDTIYNTASGKKVGYIVLNNFNSESVAKDFSILLQQMKEQHSTDFIIDLRYNSGGELQQAAECASMLAQTTDVEKTFCTIQKNNKQTETLNIPLKSASPLEQTDNLFILTSSATHNVAQTFVSSLQHINNTRQITVIGVYAKNSPYITETFASPYGFTISPVVATLFTANGEILSPNSISIAHILNEFEDVTNIFPLGDCREALLYKALTLIEN